MSSEPYVPNEADIIRGDYHLGDNFWRDLTETEVRRGIAKIKADALREAARDMRAQVERATEHQRFTEHELVESGVEHVLNEYADRIEEEARDGR
ncbi:hypothetical protein [Brevibacterium casei]|uniref:Uncharacterized protein n=1 Tax=Brevibacterium casei TaxID=33889 RepID=A0AB34XW58_9MICO|nr:hypothetical protein [Brevibacterium casei]KZE19147.1 hypothetical protein AVW13_11870 [Brevibacterium casei]